MNLVYWNDIALQLNTDGSTDVINFNIGNMSDDELDFIVTEQGGVVGTLSDGVSVNTAPLPILNDYKAVWIATMGEETKGTLLLSPTTRRGYLLYRRGQLTRLISLGFTSKLASCYLNSSRGIKFSLEESVIKCFIDNLSLLNEFGHTYKRSMDIWKWAESVGIDSYMRDNSITSRRMVCVIEVFKKIKEADGLIFI